MSPKAMAVPEFGGQEMAVAKLIEEQEVSYDDAPPDEEL